jgi:hypothetical protein
MACCGARPTTTTSPSLPPPARASTRPAPGAVLAGVPEQLLPGSSLAGVRLEAVDRRNESSVTAAAEAVELQALECTPEEASMARDLQPRMSHPCFGLPGARSGNRGGVTQLPPLELLVRFLRATDAELDKTETSLKRHFTWRSKWQPDSITQGDCATAMDSGCCRMLGTSREGNPVMWVRTKLWRPDEVGAASLQTHISDTSYLPPSCNFGRWSWGVPGGWCAVRTFHHIFHGLE